MDDERKLEHWIRISRAELPPARLRPLLDHFRDDPDALLGAGSDQWRNLGLSREQATRLERSASVDISKDLSAMHRRGMRLVLQSDLEYPQRLKFLADAPPVLYARGELSIDDQFSVAIVGSRRATSYGVSLAERFARELCQNGLCVVSGGARGVDTHAHRGALAAGGRTVAFLGCGADVTYPAENRRLFDEIVEAGQGAILSEYPIGTMPEPWRFPERNRLIAAMTVGTLVIETPLSSGAMITATDAANMGREVFAVPGPIETGMSAGCHKLIQEGAKLTQNIDDILSEIGVLRLQSPDEPRPLLPRADDLAGEHRQVLDLLSLQARNVDQIADGSGLAAGRVVGVLTMLELRGLARRVPGNAFVRVL
jgi:DNA processing protein